MKQGHYLTIDKAFQNYWENKEYLTNYPYPHAVNYQKARVKGDCYKNIPEQLILSCIDKVEDIQKQVDLVEETYKYFKHEGQLRDLYIKIIYMNKHRCTNVRAYGETLEKMYFRESGNNRPRIRLFQVKNEKGTKVVPFFAF